MAIEIHAIKVQSRFLTGLSEQDCNIIESLSKDDLACIKISKKRNGKFHRKFFAMMRVGFEAWEPEENTYKGSPIQKNFDKFREHVIILAGFYNAYHYLDGRLGLMGNSISFSNMKEDKFARLYNSCANVLLERILTNYSDEDLENHVNKILSFL